MVWVFENRIVATVGKENDFTMAQLMQTTENKKLYIWKIKGKKINPIFNYLTTK